MSEGRVGESQLKRQPAWPRLIPWGLAAALGVALVAALWTRPEPIVQPTDRVSLYPPREVADLDGNAYLSPDGSLIVFSGVGGGNESPLYLKRRNEIEAVALAGTEGADFPFFSPDGQWIGFSTSFTAGSLKKVSVNGGAPIQIAPVVGNLGSTWGEDGTIIFNSGSPGLLYRVDSSGGEPERITEIDQEVASFRLPSFLPGGKAILLTAAIAGTRDSRIEALTLANGERKVIHPSGSSAGYLPTGHLVFTWQGTLFAAPFDPDGLELLGEPIPIVDQVRFNEGFNLGVYSFSLNGSLIYRTQFNQDFLSIPVWRDRDGKILSQVGQPAVYANPALSPDGKRIAFSLSTQTTEGTSTSIWTQDLERGTRSRFSFLSGGDHFPLWSRDGKTIYFASTLSGTFDVFRKPSDGSGETERLAQTMSWDIASSMSPDGRYLVINRGIPQTGMDIFVLDLSGEGEPEPFLATQFHEQWGVFSPDGKWIAYVSDESGRPEIYIRPFPAGSGKWQISADGGSWPMWDASRSEVIFMPHSEGNLMSVPVQTKPFRIGTPRVLFPTEFPLPAFRPGGSAFGRPFALTPDGERFLTLERTEPEGPTSELIYIRNWFEEVERLVPTSR